MPNRNDAEKAAAKLKASAIKSALQGDADKARATLEKPNWLRTC